MLAAIEVFGLVGLNSPKPFNTNERKNYGHVDSTGSFSGHHRMAYHLETLHTVSDLRTAGQESPEYPCRSLRDISALLPKADIRRC
jgi:hypothetical protein